MSEQVYLGIDLGAESGRVMAGASAEAWVAARARFSALAAR
jgi:sugar (pentulose or hexulose) kinase